MKEETTCKGYHPEKEVKCPKCPKCKKSIDGLRNIQSGVNAYDCWVEEGADGVPYMEYQHDDFNIDGNVNVWNCPECGKTLFGNEEDAIEFLKEVGKSEKD